MNRRLSYRTARNIIRLVAATIFSASSFCGSLPTENKPLVVVVYADWCPLCQKLKPVLARINEKYSGKIHFVRLDVTSKETTAKSRLQAQSLGLEQFFEQSRDKTSLVVIQDPAGHEVFRAVHDYDFQHYATVLDQQLRAAPGK
jgi:thiol-disulfide isomerase/thioredoxin